MGTARTTARNNDGVCFPRSQLPGFRGGDKAAPLSSPSPQGPPVLSAGPRVEGWGPPSSLHHARPPDMGSNRSS